MSTASIRIPDTADASDYPPVPEPNYLTQFFWDGVARSEERRVGKECRL